MKTLYLDIFSGISGDMLIGALLDLGVAADRLEQELEKLGLEGYHLHVTRGHKASIEGVKFDVHLADGTNHQPTHSGVAAHTGQHSDSHQRGQGNYGPHGGPLVGASSGQVELSVFETNVPPRGALQRASATAARFRLYFCDRKGKPLAPAPAKNVALETIRPDGARQVFRFKRRAECLEATDELPEPHEFTAILKVRQGKRTGQYQTRFVEDHHHAHEHDLQHPHGPHGPPHGHGRPSPTSSS